MRCWAGGVGRGHAAAAGRDAAIPSRRGPGRGGRRGGWGRVARGAAPGRGEIRACVGTASGFCVGWDRTAEAMTRRGCRDPLDGPRPLAEQKHVVVVVITKASGFVLVLEVTGRPSCGAWPGPSAPPRSAPDESPHPPPRAARACPDTSQAPLSRQVWEGAEQREAGLGWRVRVGGEGGGAQGRRHPQPLLTARGHTARPQPSAETHNASKSSVERLG